MKAFILALMVFAAGPVHALSCLRPDAAASFNRFAASEDLYVVLYGQFVFDETALPEPPRDNPNLTNRSNPIPATFIGHSLSRNGFRTPFGTGLTLDAQCLGPWCAGMASGVKTMAFVRKEGPKYTLSINPCGGVAFAQPTPEVLQQVTACMAGKSCIPQDGVR